MTNFTDTNRDTFPQNLIAIFTRATPARLTMHWAHVFQRWIDSLSGLLRSTGAVLTSSEKVRL